MAVTDVFQVAGATVKVSATQASSGGAFPNNIARNKYNVRVYNAGPNTVFIRFGENAQTALVTDTPIPAGMVENFYTGGLDNVAAICDTGLTATVYFTPGGGI